ncbi:hypothetical protein [uncultured Luteimonas sp.]|uniref:hypothetical protein n=1 Tax=uncultured Luteimonas sp. TaxID=453144 RepID=UPI0026319B4F|nr:hypothetical protein [uncultured Luteimonas sp.]
MGETKVRIELNGDFSAPQLDEILRDLAKARAGMLPAVPEHPPSLLSAEEEVLLQDEAKFDIRTLLNGGLRIWLRNEGLGWLAFTLTPAHAASLRVFLSQERPDSGTAH